MEIRVPVLSGSGHCADGTGTAPPWYRGAAVWRLAGGLGHAPHLFLCKIKLKVDRVRERVVILQK